MQENQKNRPAALIDASFALGLAKAQILLLLTAPVIALLCKDWVAAISIGCGVIIGCFGHLYATWRCYYAQRSKRRDAKHVVSAMMKASLGKQAIVMLGLLMAFKYMKPLDAGMLLLGLGLIQIMAWVYPQWLYRDK